MEKRKVKVNYDTNTKHSNDSDTYTFVIPDSNIKEFTLSRNSENKKKKKQDSK